MSLGKLLKDTMHMETSELLVTPRVTQFLYDNPQGLTLNRAGTALSRDSKRIISEVMDKGFAGNEDRTGRFGASARGTCERKQMFTFLGMPVHRIQDPELSNLFNDGKYRHLKWQIMGLQSGALTDVEVGIAMPALRMRSSIDGVNEDEGFIFELKGDRYPARMMEKSGGVDEKHDLQIHSMFIMTGYDLCSYVVEDKSSQNWREVVVEKNKATTRKVLDEMNRLNQSVDDKVLPEPLAACKVKEGPYKTCPFAVQCIKRWKASNNYFPLDSDWAK
jgi:hypothetical protein